MDRYSSSSSSSSSISGESCESKSKKQFIHVRNDGKYREETAIHSNQSRICRLPDSVSAVSKSLLLLFVAVSSAKPKAHGGRSAIHATAMNPESFMVDGMNLDKKDKV